MANPSICVAIVGGGLADTSLGNALIHIPQLDVHIFESASEFSEWGAAIGLSHNAQRALQQLIPSAMELLRAAGAVSTRSSRLMIGSGPQAGKSVCNVGEEDEDSESAEPALVVHRTSLLRVIEDFDAVISADEVFSVVRQHIMPDSEWAGTPSGF
ncbi:hypothetical protein NPX13_g3896 [Xylaria arbuscula]|uniref:Uncharacterized protein n=1 Tax=Xylaria arbuscula TaxID=114810 RepID=A0A9W8TPN1_9PEZI|nr:hypothetical protein NPX13_g3896 [Xylaria arbuscula]